MTPDDLTRTSPPDATRDQSDAALDAGLAAAFGGDTTHLRPPPADPEAGTVIAGRYRLTEKVGEGGMGSVWVAQQSEPVKRKVAVKLIKAGMDSKQVLARFEAERQALAVMDHPNIAKVLDGGLHDGRPYFVMELVKGVPITTFCDARKLTPQQRLELFVPVCQAIQHAHQKGVIHRDIKPSNVLVALYDDRPVVKVIDFGIAKATGAALTEHTLDTGFGAVVGTPAYMSPEQASLNNLDIDTRSDVYALGVLLYELLTGSPPFSGQELQKKGMLEMLRVVREEEPPRPSHKLSTADALPSLSASRGTEPKKLTGLLRNELDWIVMKALEKDRTRRYETANGFAADVNRYLSGEAVQAHPPSAGYRVSKFVRKQRGPVTAAGVVFFALVAGVVGTTWQANRAEQARQGEADQRKQVDEALEREAKQRVVVESQLAGQMLDRAIEEYAGQEEKQLEGRLIRLANTLTELPASATAIRQLLTRRILIDGHGRLSPYHFFDKQDATWRERTAAPGVVAKWASPESGRPFVCRVSDRQTGKELRRITTEPVANAHLSDDAKSLIVTTRYDATGEFRAYDLRTGSMKWKCPYPKPEADAATDYHQTGSAVSSALSPDGSRLIVTRNRRVVAFGQRVVENFRTELWDTAASKLIAEFQDGGHHFFTSHCGADVFTVTVPRKQPDGSTALDYEARALSDGRLLKTLDGWGWITPSGKHLVTVGSHEVTWVRTTDWEVAGRCPFDASAVQFGGFSSMLLTDDWVVQSNFNMGSMAFYGQPVSLLAVKDAKKAVTLRDGVISGDAAGLLLHSGHLFDFASGTLLKRPKDRQFHPDARRFAVFGRHIPYPDPRVGWFDKGGGGGGNDPPAFLGRAFNPRWDQIIDLAADRSLNLFEQENLFEQNTASGLRGLKYGPSHTGQGKTTNDPEAELRGITWAWRLLPGDDASIDPADLHRWACLIEMGHLDDDGAFHHWSPEEWDTKHAEFKAKVAPTAGFPFADLIPNEYGAAVYLRDQFPNEATAENTELILNRILARHPTLGHAYVLRGDHHFEQEKYTECVRDYRAARDSGVVLSEVLRDGDHSSFPSFLHLSGLPRRTLDELAELFEVWPPIGDAYRSWDEIHLTYRRGDYRTALREAERRMKEDNGVYSKPVQPLEQLCHLFAAVGSPVGLLSPLPATPQVGKYSNGQDPSPRDEALACLCMHHLGDQAEAATRWRKFKKTAKRFTSNPTGTLLEAVTLFDREPPKK